MDKEIMQAAQQWAQSEGMDETGVGKVLAQMEVSDFAVFCDAAKNGDHATMSEVYMNSTQIDETFNSSIQNPASQFDAKPGKGTADHGAEQHLSSPEAPVAPDAAQMGQLSQDIATISKQPDGSIGMEPIQPEPTVQPDATGQPDFASPEEVAATVDLNDPEVQHILKLAGGLE